MSESQRRPCTTPPRAHPLVRALYGRMAEIGVTYNELAARSGVKKSAFKAWRCTNSPGTNSVQAALNAVSLQALPVPRLDTLPRPLVEELEAIGQRHGIAIPVAQLMIVAAERPPKQKHHVRQAQ